MSSVAGTEAEPSQTAKAVPPVGTAVTYLYRPRANSSLLFSQIVIPVEDLISLPLASLLYLKLLWILIPLL